MLARYHAWKADTVAQLGGKCVKCGSTEALEFHHRVPAEKSFTVSKGWSQTSDVLAAELEKCDLLCDVCHKIEHGPAHGGERRYNSGCRCEMCVAGWKARLPARVAYKRRRRAELRGLRT